MAWLLAGCAGLAPMAQAAVNTALEAKVMAAYVFHMIKFVEWPALPEDGFRICVHDDDAVSTLLSELANRTVRDRPLRIETDGDLARCQVLFLGRGEKSLGDILPKTRRQGVLTVSAQSDFARKGGIVGFYMDAGKLRLEVNPEAAKAANLRMSAKLLELSRTVPPGRE